MRRCPFYLWHAVDAEGEVLDFLIQSKCNKAAALELMRKLLEQQGVSPTPIITGKLSSYGAALRELGFSRRHETGPLELVRAYYQIENADVRQRRRDAVRAVAGEGRRGRRPNV